MALSEASKLTTVSGEGGVVLPDGVLKKLRWSAGTTLIVEETPDGVLLKRTSPFPSTCIEDVAGMLRYEGPAKTIAEMDEGVLEEARRRFDRSRY